MIVTKLGFEVPQNPIRSSQAPAVCRFNHYLLGHVSMSGLETLGAVTVNPICGRSASCDHTFVT